MEWVDLLRIFPQSVFGRASTLEPSHNGRNLIMVVEGKVLRECTGRTAGLIFVVLASFSVIFRRRLDPEKRRAEERGTGNKNLELTT